MIEFILDALTVIWDIFHWAMFVIGVLIFVFLFFYFFLFKEPD